MRVLLTGSLGRVGPFLRAALEKAGHDVVRLDLRERPDRHALAGDLHDPRLCARAVRGCEGVVHLAVAREGLAENVITTRALARAAAEAGVARFFFPSSINVLGSSNYRSSPTFSTPARLPIDETVPCDPEDAYSQGKLACERLLHGLGRDSAMRIYCARLPGLWLPDRTYHHHPEPLPRLDPCRLVDPWIYLDVRDLARLVLAFLERPHVPQFGLSYAVGPDTTRPESTAWLWQRFLPDWLPLFPTPPQGHEPWFSNEKVRRDLGWEPHYSWRRSPRAHLPRRPGSPHPLSPASWGRRYWRVRHQVAIRIRRSHFYPETRDFLKLFRSLRVDRVASGFQFTEGPLWRDGALIFSDIPKNAIFRLDPAGNLERYRAPSFHSNGLTLDGQGRLLACHHGRRNVSREEPDGRLTVLADRYQGRRLNSPNDLVARSDGPIYFTDPPYGIHESEQELEFSGLYRIDPDGSLHLLGTDFCRPNGLAFSPDESTLYLNDTTLSHIRAFPVRPDGNLGPGAVLRVLEATGGGMPDGLKVDADGRLYCCGPGGLSVLEPDGRLLGRVRFPEVAVNCAWGGPQGSDLFVTARSAVYRMQLNVRGTPFPAGQRPAVSPTRS